MFSHACAPGAKAVTRGLGDRQIPGPPPERPRRSDRDFWGKNMESMDGFRRENLNRKPWFLHVFTIKLIGVSGQNVPMMQFYDGKNQGIFMGIFMGIFSREIMNNGGILRIFQHFLNQRYVTNMGWTLWIHMTWPQNYQYGDCMEYNSDQTCIVIMGIQQTIM
jgi:hypothetical protein